MQYQAPIEDMTFLLRDVFPVTEQLGQFADFAEFDMDLYEAILEEAGKFCTGALLPLYQSGDEQGCQFADGEVTTPEGYKQAYQDYIDAGWQSITGDPEYGGQGLPKALHVLIEEMVYACNTSFCLYGSLTAGAYHCLHAHGSDDMKAQYLPNLVSGQWSGTMCLTESHAGSDLGLLKTKAEPADDGSYQLSGSKIFITGGEHDLAENIIHLVLARLPDAPAGPKGISLFLVPKFLPDADNNPGERNAIHCGSIEHKMGIKASATCVMNLDGAKGWLIGEPGRGLNCMFTMMNLERLSIGIQGIGHGELAYQQASQYASERLQGRSAQSGKSTAPIAQHKDVERMLLTMRAFNEAGRALAVWMGGLIDVSFHSDDPAEAKHASDLSALLTPVAKAYFSDAGYETSNLGLQCFGGHGYVKEWGMEQIVRDCRIAQLYEGTNGIQALDLLGRKILSNKGELFKLFSDATLSLLGDKKFAAAMPDNHAGLNESLATLQTITDQLIASVDSEDAMQAVAYDYLNAFALVTYSFLLNKMAWRAQQNGYSGAADKLKLANFFDAKILPRLQTAKLAIESGAKPYA